jgi:hypothetical protein
VRHLQQGHDFGRALFSCSHKKSLTAAPDLGQNALDNANQPRYMLSTRNELF